MIEKFMFRVMAIAIMGLGICLSYNFITAEKYQYINIILALGSLGYCTSVALKCLEFSNEEDK